MNTIPVAYHKWYVVSGPVGGTVTSVDGSVTYCTIPEGGQGSFYAVTTEVVVSDAAISVDECQNFKGALVLGGNGGGGNISFDSTPTSGSGNAVTSGGLYNVLYDGTSLKLGKQGTVQAQAIDLSTGTGYAKGNCVVIGHNAYSTAVGTVAIGSGANSGEWGVAIGMNVQAKMTSGTVAIGSSAQIAGSHNRCIVIGSDSKILKGADVNMSTLLGYNATVKNSGVTCIATWDSRAFTVQTLLYIIAAGSELATQYEGGEACLGYVVKESSGNVLACGTRKLSELLTSNTAFAPAAMDLDAPAPMPFLPAGIMEPVEFED